MRVLVVGDVVSVGLENSSPGLRSVDGCSSRVLNRGCHDAIEAIFCAVAGRNPHRRWILDADLAAAFDRIDHNHLLAALGTFPAPGTGSPSGCERAWSNANSSPRPRRELRKVRYAQLGISRRMSSARAERGFHAQGRGPGRAPSPTTRGTSGRAAAAGRGSSSSSTGAAGASRSAPSSAHRCARRRGRRSCTPSGACFDVCPVRIDIPSLLVRLRSQKVEEARAHSRVPSAEAVAMAAASWPAGFGAPRKSQPTTRWLRVT